MMYNQILKLSIIKFILLNHFSNLHEIILFLENYSINCFYNVLISLSFLISLNIIKKKLQLTCITIFKVIARLIIYSLKIQYSFAYQFIELLNKLFPTEQKKGL